MITKVINVNLHQPIYERLTAKQGDIASRYLLFHLLDGDKPFDLSNRTVRVYAIKPDKTEIFNDLAINDASKGYCTLELTSQCLASAGVVKMELYISESGKVLTSIPFELEVIACINTANSVTSTNEFSALEVALGSLQNYDNFKRGTGERLDNIDSQLDKKANIKTKNVTGSTGGYFKAPEQPSFSEGDGEIINNNDYNEIINKLDKYVDGSYIKKELLGKDTTNTHNIYKYIVEPEKYSKTIVLISGQHGNEKVGVYTIARLFHYLTDEETYLKYPQISEIRNNVRLIIIAFANPAGYVAHTRNNGNGVDINRNYDYRWNNNTGDKGASAFSEKETQYIRDTIDKYKNDTCFVIDYHNFVGSGQGQKYVCWTNKFTTNVLNDIQKYIRTNESSLSKIDVRVGGTASSLDNYSNIKFQIPTITAENADLLRGEKFYDGLELQYSLTWMVNLIMIGYKKAEQKQATNILEPFAKVVHYRCPSDYATGLKVEATSADLVMKDFEELKIEFDVPCHGILEVTGVATVYSTDTQDQVKVVGVLGQNGGEIKGSEYWYNTVFGVLEESPYNRYNTSTVIKRSIPFTTCIRVIPSDMTVGKGYFYPRIGATWHTNYLASLKATVKFTPSNHGLANEIIDIYPSDGVEGTSTSFTQGKLYPDIVY